MIRLSAAIRPIVSAFPDVAVVACIVVSRLARRSLALRHTLALPYRDALSEGFIVASLCPVAPAGRLPVDLHPATSALQRTPGRFRAVQQNRRGGNASF
jgi:hypothetical protein